METPQLPGRPHTASPLPHSPRGPPHNSPPFRLPTPSHSLLPPVLGDKIPSVPQNSLTQLQGNPPLLNCNEDPAPSFKLNVIKTHFNISVAIRNNPGERAKHLRTREVVNHTREYISKSRSGNKTSVYSVTESRTPDTQVSRASETYILLLREFHRRTCASSSFIPILTLLGNGGERERDREAEGHQLRVRRSIVGRGGGGGQAFRGSLL
ncbi:hypothetical protein E2C01_024979 [Portunus trituberculatus]|uniref:Uncharacterized protein n=1 Tax=Portunus trituberculatus TaxID=210409 RepID=A0A5B7EFC1_PORTR|nr:hypothetical protein [Portunus trituberculatus]